MEILTKIKKNGLSAINRSFEIISIGLRYGAGVILPLCGIMIPQRRTCNP
jgi:hypothetical protein